MWIIKKQKSGQYSVTQGPIQVAGVKDGDNMGYTVAMSKDAKVRKGSD